MKTEKLSRLLSALGKPVNQNQEIKKTSEESVERTGNNSVDAVNVSLSKQVSDQQSTDTERQEKVARIKEQVQNGSYQVDSNKIAAAVITDLGLF